MSCWKCETCGQVVCDSDFCYHYNCKDSIFFEPEIEKEAVDREGEEE